MAMSHCRFCLANGYFTKCPYCLTDKGVEYDEYFPPVVRKAVANVQAMAQEEVAIDDAPFTQVSKHIRDIVKFLEGRIR